MPRAFEIGAGTDAWVHDDPPSVVVRDSCTSVEPQAIAVQSEALAHESPETKTTVSGMTVDDHFDQPSVVLNMTTVVPVEARSAATQSDAEVQDK
jgi:hypothetical protein